jgi:predicted DNA-binding transcriptional regulator AlpA
MATEFIPRLLTRDQAATYCGLSRQAFSTWVRQGRLPGPVFGSARWDLRAIDAALDSASGLAKGANTSALDQWKAGKHARSA